MAEAAKAGYIETLVGRRRAFPNLSSEDTSERRAAERAAINTLIQGIACDMVI